MSESIKRSVYEYLLIHSIGSGALSSSSKMSKSSYPNECSPASMKTELAGIAQGCRNTLKEIERTLDGYRELNSSGKSFGGKILTGVEKTYMGTEGY